MELPGPIALPCPLRAGWQIVEQTVLPRAAGGGFSAGAYRKSSDELWLLSDAPRGSISRWQGLARGGVAQLRPLPPLPLAQPLPMDGEGLVLDRTSLWAASEGRLQPPRPAELLHGSWWLISQPRCWACRARRSAWGRGPSWVTT